MKPLATYHERLVPVSRFFELYEDRVEVRAKWLFGREYRSVVRLDTLKSEYRPLKIRLRWFRYTSWAFAAGAVMTAMAIYPYHGEKLSPWAWAGLAIAVLGLLGIAITYSKVDFVRFDPASGRRGGLDIARSGPDAGRFQEFAEKVRKQIRKA